MVQNKNGPELDSPKGSILEPDRTLISQLIDRCQKANRKTQLRIFTENDYLLTVSVPSGREERRLFMIDTEAVSRLMQVEFENYVFIQGYQSICSHRDGLIEAYIRLLRPIRTEFIFSRLLGIPSNEIRKGKKRDLAFEVKHQIANKSTITISISQPSNTILALTDRELEDESGLTIKIHGLEVPGNEQAAKLLEKLANSLFFQIEISVKLPLMLETYYERPVPFIRAGKKKAKTPDVGFPKFEYDRDPLNLYWYAKSARRIPLLQFLAYYQVLEFYFPTYSRKEANRAVANIVKDPAFTCDHDLHLTKIVSAVLSKVGKGYGEEKQQLRSTIRECVEVEELIQLIEGSDHIGNHFKSDFKKLSPIKISVANKDYDIRDQLADRLYDIRCRIVHTKAGETEEERILPFTEEESLLPIEIEIAEFIARKAIIAGSRRLSI